MWGHHFLISKDIRMFTPYFRQEIITALKYPQSIREADWYSRTSETFLDNFPVAVHTADGVLIVGYFTGRAYWWLVAVALGQWRADSGRNSQ